MASVGRKTYTHEEYLELERKDTFLNPSLLGEILSPSTEAYDRGEKSAHDRRLSSLQEYILISQDKILVERYTRQGEDWLLFTFSEPNTILNLTSIQRTSQRYRNESVHY